MGTEDFWKTHIGKATIALIIALFFGIIPYLGWLIAIIAYIVAFTNLKKDCEELNISIWHAALIFIGIIGVVIYFLQTAKYRKGYKVPKTEYTTNYDEISDLHKEHYSKKDDMSCDNNRSSAHRVNRFIDNNSINVIHKHSKNYKRISSTGQEVLIKVVGILLILGLLIYYLVATYLI